MAIFNTPLGMNVVDNPLVLSVWDQGDADDNISPLNAYYLMTEGGVFIMTEGTVFITTE